MMKKAASLIVAIFTCTTLLAQTAPFGFYSELDTVKQPGFYTIPISSRFTPYLKTDLSDVRIADATGRWVPHLVFTETGVSRSAVSFDLQVLNIKNSAASTVVLVKNNADAADNLNLLINNNNVERFSSLSGSNDLKQWYIISDSLLLAKNPEAGGKATVELRFPSQDYRYFKVTIFNLNKDPINIFRASVSTTGKTIGFPEMVPEKNPGGVLTQKDSNHLSIIKLVLDAPYHIDQLTIQTSGVKYFSRALDVCLPMGEKDVPGMPLYSTRLSNNSNGVFNMPLIQTGILYLLVHNEDNPPLVIEEIATAAHYRSLNTYLEAGKSYQLLLHAAVTAPSYDLGLFYDSMPKLNPVLTTGPVKPFAKQVVQQQERRTNNWLTWGALAVALLLLSLLAFKMTRKVSNKNTDDHL